MSKRKRNEGEMESREFQNNFKDFSDEIRENWQEISEAASSKLKPGILSLLPRMTEGLQYEDDRDDSVYTGKTEESSVSLCGNEILEEGEMCDCGYEGSCTDNCCIAQSADNSRINACQLTNTAMCSPIQGDCCDPTTCMFQSSSHVCKVEDECSFNATCTGNSIMCSTPSFKPDNTLCETGRKVCSNGMCVKSICGIHNLEECQCSTDLERCELCCQNLGQPQSCVATSRINIRAPNGDILHLPIGSPCNNFMGYCDVFDACRLANEDGPLAAILRKIFFNDEPQLTDAIWTFIQEKWWVIVIIVVVLIIVMIAVVALCQCIVPSTNPYKRQKDERPERRSSANVQLQKKRNRGSRYYDERQAPAPPSYDQHPDNAENRATRF